MLFASLASITVLIAAGLPPPRPERDAVEASVGTSLPSLHAERYFAEGPFAIVDRAIKRGDARTVVTALRRLTKKHLDAPETPKARYVLGVSLMQIGAFEEAARLFGELAETYPELRDDHLFLRGQALHAWGNHLDAADALALVDPEGPRGREAMRLRAFALLRATAFDRVVAWLAEVEKRDGHLDPELTFVLARARHRTGDVLGAYHAFREVWRDAPGAALAGAALVELSDLSIGDAPILSESERSIVRSLRARLLSGANADRTLRDLDARLARARAGQNLRAEVAYVRGRIAEACGQLRGARTYYARASALASGDAADLRARVALSAAKLAERLGDEPRALVHYRTLAARFPERPESEEALFRAAEMLLTLRRYPEAESTFNALLLKNPVTPYRARAVWGIGWARYRVGEYRRAREFFASLTKMSLSGDVDAAARYWLGRTETQLGDATAARASYASVLERHPLSHYAAMAEAHLGSGHGLLPAAVPPAPAARPSTELAHVREYLRLGLRGQAVEALGAYEATLLAARKKDPDLLRAVAGLYEDAGRGADARRVRVLLEREFPPSLHDGAYVAAQRRVHPVRFEAPIRAAAAEFGLSSSLLFALIRTESSFQPRATSNMAAYGLSQLVLPTAEEVARRLRAGHVTRARLIEEPELNVRLGAAYLRSLIDRYRGSEPLALAAYNAGPTAVDRWLSARARTAEAGGKGRVAIKPAADELSEEIPVAETKAFVKNVLSRARGYACLYPPTGPQLAEEEGGRSGRGGRPGEIGNPAGAGRSGRGGRPGEIGNPDGAGRSDGAGKVTASLGGARLE